MSEPTLRVPVEKLRAVFELLLAHVADDSKGSVAVQNDYFWSVPGQVAYDPYAEPTTLTIGQTSESWRNLESILDDPSKVIGYGLVWLADVLRAIGDENIG